MQFEDRDRKAAFSVPESACAHVSGDILVGRPESERVAGRAG